MFRKGGNKRETAYDVDGQPRTKVENSFPRLWSSKAPPTKAATKPTSSETEVTDLTTLTQESDTNDIFAGNDLFEASQFLGLDKTPTKTPSTSTKCYDEVTEAVTHPLNFDDN